MRLQFPAKVHIELTNKCNLNCSFCPRQYINDDNDFIQDDLWKKLIQECSKHKSTVMPFWRGESLLHPRFCELIDYAADNNVDMELATNGILISEENVSSLMKMKIISISIHNEKSFEKAIWLAKQKNTKYPLIQISFVSNESTVKTVMNEVIENKKLYSNLFNRVRLYEEHSVDGVFGANLIKKNELRKYCSKLDNLLVVSANGYVSRCTYLWECEDGFNANNSSLFDIWNSQKYSDISRNYPDKRCENCDQWNGATNGEIFELNSENQLEAKIT